MRKSHQLRSQSVVSSRCGAAGLRALLCGFALSAALVGVGSPATAAGYNEATQGDLSNLSGSPTKIGTLSLGNNYIVGSSTPSGDLIPDGHGALTNQDNDFFTFTVPTGDVLSRFELESDSVILDGDRFFLGIYPGQSSPVDPNNPTPAGLLGYTLPGSSQVPPAMSPTGTDLLPYLAASNEAGFPPLAQHFSGSLGAGSYTVWLVDGDAPIKYDLNLVVASAPEVGTWMLMLAGVGLMGVMLRQRRPRRSAVVIS